MFIGRKDELARLGDFYVKASARVACIYGRRGMGKTALLREFSKDKKTCFFTAYPTAGEQELQLFAAAIGVEWHENTTLEDLLNAIEKIGMSEPVLLIIDHYPDFVKAKNTFEKTLYRYVTERWVRLPIKLILCGDSFLQMERHVYGKKGIWRNDISEMMELRALDFFEAREFFPEADPKEAVMFYGLSGGIPHALKALRGTVEESVASVFLRDEDASTLLPEKTLSLELRELSYYNRMLSTLAKGSNRVNAISANVGKPKDIVVPYMNTLISIGVVKKENPVTEKTNRKKTRYSIINPFDLFWYKYVVPNIGLYFNRDTKRLLNERILPDLYDFQQTVFVQMCKEFLVRRSNNGGLPFTINDIGNWWENDEEAHTSDGFDLVALGSEPGGKSAIMFARCYYTDTPVEIATLKELIELTKKAKHKNSSNEDVFYVAFSSSGFNENAQTVASAIKNIMLVPLEEICKE